MLTRERLAHTGISINADDAEFDAVKADLSIKLMTGDILCDIRDALIGINKELCKQNHPPVMVAHNPDLTDVEFEKLRKKAERFKVQPGKIQISDDDKILNRYKLALRLAVERIHANQPTDSAFERIVAEDVAIYLAQAKDAQEKADEKING